LHAITISAAAGITSVASMMPNPYCNSGDITDEKASPTMLPNPYCNSGDIIDEKLSPTMLPNPYCNSGDIIDEKSSPTAWLPKLSKFAKRLPGKTAHTLEALYAQQSQRYIETPQPQEASPPEKLIPRHQLSQPGQSGIPSQPPSQAQIRTSGTESAPNSLSGGPDKPPLHATPDDTITLADTYQFIEFLEASETLEAAHAAEQQRSSQAAKLSALKLASEGGDAMFPTPPAEVSNPSRCNHELFISIYIGSYLRKL